MRGEKCTQFRKSRKYFCSVIQGLITRKAEDIWPLSPSLTSFICCTYLCSSGHKCEQPVHISIQWGGGGRRESGPGGRAWTEKFVNRNQAGMCTEPKLTSNWLPRWYSQLAAVASLRVRNPRRFLLGKFVREPTCSWIGAFVNRGPTVWIITKLNCCLDRCYIERYVTVLYLVTDT
jgi:hypothetical protein